MEQVFSNTWQQLQNKMPLLEEFLEQVTIRNLRGIQDLTIPFSYPVSVLAGENSSGKSTVLYALACAYKVPGAGPRDYTPSTFFPDFRPNPQLNFPADHRNDKAEIEYLYRTKSTTKRMLYKRGASGKWNPSFFGQKGGQKISRQIYMRKLSNATNPSEVGKNLALARNSKLTMSNIQPSLAYFAEQILPYDYEQLYRFSVPGKQNQLLFAEAKSNVGSKLGEYSEFQMSSGERAVLELSLELTELQGALVLIDEVDMGLHPSTQKKLMLQLQELALRNDLQIIVTTHSPVVLDCVPPVARLFLERGPEGVALVERYRDMVQRALYGQSQTVLSILCEDKVSENLISGVVDVLGAKMRIHHSSITIGRDTGASEFMHHAQLLEKFNLTEGFLFILDGDEAGEKAANELKSFYSGRLSVLNLPGNDGPEEWIWQALRNAPQVYAEKFGWHENDFSQLLRDKEQLYSSTAGPTHEKAKYRLASFSDEVGRKNQKYSYAIAEVARDVGQREAEVGNIDMVRFMRGLEDAITRWRGA